MCLYVLDITPKPQVAKEDMIVYKRLYRIGKGEYQSPYVGYYYNRGQVYESQIGKLKKRRHHPMTLMNHNRNQKVTIIGTIDSGIHAYTSKVTAKTRSKDADIYEQEAIITCVIPKGAKYYLGKGNEIVTDKLYIGTKIK